MIDRNLLMSYAKILEEYSNPNFVFTDEYRRIVGLVNNSALNDENLRNLINELNNSTDKNAVIGKYFDEMENSNNNEEELIAEAYGVDISKIEHKTLHNGKEVFVFYDVNTNRNVILENKKDGVSLVEQLKERQLQNTAYQGNDNMGNVQNMMGDMVQKDNCELVIIPIENINEHLNEIQNLTQEELQMLNFLLKNSAAFDIKYINIENIIGLNSEGKIFEVYKDSNLEFKIAEPNSMAYGESDINVSNRVNNEFNSVEQSAVLQNQYEDVPRELEYNANNDDLSFDDLSEDMQEKVIILHDNPMMMDNMSSEERFYWQKLIELYNKKLELQEQEELNKTNNQVKVKKHVLRKEGSNGFINFFQISLIVSFAILLFTVIYAFFIK